ncbi:MAG: hypothetical protein IJX14_07885 [Clostridia bacterium]|nr:hypothetical protein [Clostridia bacterium]
MADTLRLLSENMAKAAGGAYVTARLSELLHPEPADVRTTEEKFYDTISKLGFKVVG